MGWHSCDGVGVAGDEMGNSNNIGMPLNQCISLPIPAASVHSSHSHLHHARTSSLHITHSPPFPHPTSYLISSHPIPSHHISHPTSHIAYQSLASFPDCAAASNSSSVAERNSTGGEPGWRDTVGLGGEIGREM